MRKPGSGQSRSMTWDGTAPPNRDGASFSESIAAATGLSMQAGDAALAGSAGWIAEAACQQDGGGEGAAEQGEKMTTLGHGLGRVNVWRWRGGNKTGAADQSCSIRCILEV